MSGAGNVLTHQQGQLTITFSRDFVSWLLNSSLGTRALVGVFTPGKLARALSRSTLCPREPIYPPTTHRAPNSAHATPTGNPEWQTQTHSPGWVWVLPRPQRPLLCPQAPHSVIQQTVL